MNHHAYLLIGPRSWAFSEIPGADSVEGSDVTILTSDRMGIDEARALAYASNLAPISRAERVFVIVADALTTEAQNALLKLFEEPSATARFYLIVPNETILLPTLRSRLLLLARSDLEVGDSHVFKRFLDSSHGERLKEIERYTKQKDDRWIESVVRGYEQYAESKALVGLVQDVVFVRTYLRDQGASKKMLLEHLALSLP